MNKIIIALFNLWLTLVPFQANAGFLDSNSSWQMLNHTQKAIYAMGSLDGFVTYYSGPYMEAVTKSVVQCTAYAPNFTPSMLAESIDKAYRDNPDIRSRAPSRVVYYVVVRLCERRINEALTRANLTPLVSEAGILRGLKDH